MKFQSFRTDWNAGFATVEAAIFTGGSRRELISWFPSVETIETIIKSISLNDSWSINIFTDYILIEIFLLKIHLH